jgi:hypothetical protein
MKDDDTWTSSSRVARGKDVRLGLDITFDGVTHALTDDVADDILGEHLDHGWTLSFDAECPEHVAPGALELDPARPPRVERSDPAAAAVNEERPERTRWSGSVGWRLEDFAKPRDIAPG